MILHRTHFGPRSDRLAGEGCNNAKYEQQSFYQLNRLYQHTQETSG